MESSKSKRRRLMMSYVPRRPDLPATFESLIDDTLTTILEFVGDKSYAVYAMINKHCKEIYLSSGMTKKTFLFGHAPLSVFKVYIERVGYDRELCQRLGKGVVYYNRRDVFEWSLEERKKDVLKGICNIAAEEGRLDILNEVMNNVEDDEDNKQDIFRYVDLIAAEHGKLEVLKCFETKGISIEKDWCACEAAHHGQLHILQWLQEEKGLQLYGGLHVKTICGKHLHVMKWLRQQEVDWYDHDTFPYAAKEGNLDILQWPHDEGCPWPEDYYVPEDGFKPEVIEWCRLNVYDNRMVSRGN